VAEGLGVTVEVGVPGGKVSVTVGEGGGLVGGGSEGSNVGVWLGGGGAVDEGLGVLVTVSVGSKVTVRVGVGPVGEGVTGVEVGVSDGVREMVGVGEIVGVRVSVGEGVVLGVAVGPLNVGGRFTTLVRLNCSTMPDRTELRRRTGQSWLISGLMIGWV
jgi:hypothetical protein